jgi:hypothetical protein
VCLQVANEVIGEMNLKPEEVFLAQGTLRPDLIESASQLASGKAELIKTHHNDTELIRKLRDEVDTRTHLFPSQVSWYIQLPLLWTILTAWYWYLFYFTVLVYARQQDVP